MLLSEELKEGFRTTRFRNAAVRQAILLGGVFWLGWPARDAAVFFLLESFFFLALRAAVEISLDERYGPVERRPLPAALRVAGHLVVTVPLVGCLVGFFGMFAMIPFGGEPMPALREALHDPSYLGAVALLAGSLVYDAGLFARRVLAGRTAEERAHDDESKWFALARPVVLVIAAFTLGVAANTVLGERAVVLAVAGAVLFLEAVPQHAIKLFKPEPR